MFEFNKKGRANMTGIQHCYCIYRQIMYTLKNFALQFITINTPPPPHNTFNLKKMDVNDPVNKSIKVKSPCIDRSDCSMTFQ